MSVLPGFNNTIAIGYIWVTQAYKQHFIIAVAQFNRNKHMYIYVCVGNKPNYVYLNIISTKYYVG